MVLRNLARFGAKVSTWQKAVPGRGFASEVRSQEGTKEAVTLGKAHEMMDREVTSLVNSLSKIPNGKAHPGYFNSIKVYAFMEWVPINTAARVTAVSDTELHIEAYDPSISPLIEIALQKSGLKLDITRDFGMICVKLLDDNKESALEQISTQVSYAREAIEDVKVEVGYNLQDRPDMLRKLAYLTSQKLQAVEQLGAMYRAEL
jgi:ribosome recycling factor